MDEFDRLVRLIRSNFLSIQATSRPGVVFLYFGKGTGLEVRPGERGRFECTLLNPMVPVQTVAATEAVVLAMIDDLLSGRIEACAHRGLRLMRSHPSGA
jgi:hypothetical protein